ncbi:MAG TPA: hypothetical protein PKZ42_15485 [Syntrophales bacterium]|nr:hypothetical protein [Syntrophales bacterium]
MAFFFLQLFAFVMFFQPVFVFPALVPLRPYQSSALLALAAYLLAGDKGGKPFLANKYTQFFLLFVTMQIMSASSIWLRAGWEILFVWLNYIIIFFLIVKESTDVHRIRKLSFIIVAALVYLSYDSIRRYEPGVRASGFGWYENANDVVLILVTVIPLVFYLIETSQHKLWRYLYFIIAVLFTINIFLCGSRQGLLGLVIVGIPSLISMKGIPKLFRTSLSVALMIAIFTTGFAVVRNAETWGEGLQGMNPQSHELCSGRPAYVCLKIIRFSASDPVSPRAQCAIMAGYAACLPIIP